MKHPTSHPLSARSPLFSKLRSWAGVLLFFAASTLVRASDLPPPFVLNLPFEANQATPSWLGHPETPPTAFATLNLAILAPDPNASLLVTLYFQEKQGGFLRIVWQGVQGSQLLSDNFYEGIGMSNQRSLLITAQTLQGDGILNLQCGDTRLGIQRVKLEWLENRNALVSPAVQDLLVTPATGLTQPAQNLNGELKQADAAAWHDQIVNVPITDLPQRIEQGVEFSVELDNVPGSARLALKESGLPLGKHLVVWVNQQRAGTITPTVPDLLDTGFLADATSSNSYVGWREGSFYVPVAFLKAGVDAIQFSMEDDAPLATGTVGAPSSAPTLPLAIKDAVLQLDYPPQTPVPPSAPQPEPQTPSDATGPIEPAPTPEPAPSTTNQASPP